MGGGIKKSKVGLEEEEGVGGLVQRVIFACSKIAFLYCSSIERYCFNKMNLIVTSLLTFCANNPPPLYSTVPMSSPSLLSKWLCTKTKGF